MKKLMIFVALLLSFMPVLFMQGCSSNDSSVIQYNVKYYDIYDIADKELIETKISNNEVSSFEFKNKSTGIMRYWTYGYNSQTQMGERHWFNVDFKYTFVDETSIVITYNLKNSVYDDETYTNTSSGIHTSLLFVSKNVVGVQAGSGITYYYNANYLKQINYAE